MKHVLTFPTDSGDKQIAITPETLRKLDTLRHYEPKEIYRDLLISVEQVLEATELEKEQRDLLIHLCSFYRELYDSLPDIE